MADQSCTDQFADKSCEVGSNGVHSVAEVFGELRAIFRYGYDLVAEVVYMVYILVGDFTAHTDFSSNLKSCFKVFGEDLSEGS